MKLINKISLNFLISAFVIFILISAVTYITVERTISNEADEQLINTYHKVSGQLKKGEKINSPPFVELRHNANKNLKPGFKDVFLYTDSDKEEEPFREYSSLIKIDGKEYVLFVRSSAIEKEELLYALLKVTGVAFFIFLVMILILNKFISQKVFKDLYKTISQLDNFSLAENKPLTFDNTKITEFKKLNYAIKKLAEKSVSEYKSLKEFTEETNHEIQTPAAVAKSKLEILLQSENLKEAELQILNTALNNLNKLERISKSILLLNKLEHKNLFDISEVNIADKVKKVLESFSDFIAFKKISLDISLDEKLIIASNPALMNILISNLISNAIKHNYEDGKILVQLKNNQLTISNTAKHTSGDIEKYFNRFYKESASSDSIGLGLTIAKKICELYKLRIENKINDDMYVITIYFHN